MTNILPTITIGLPVFNGEAYLSQALDSILNQDFQHFKVIVSDNASTDGTGAILERYASKDNRIQFNSLLENIGAENNFKRVASNIQTPYFMWFAADDVMEKEFLAECINVLETSPEYVAAFTGLNNIDSLGRVIRHYPCFEGFSCTRSISTIARFIYSPEIFGKANLIYSVYRTKVFSKVIERGGIPKGWGGDMAFVLAILAEGGIYVSQDVLFHKRWVRPGDNGPEIIPVELPVHLSDQSCPLSHYEEYERAINTVVSGTSFDWLVAFLMRLRRRHLEQLDSVRWIPGEIPNQTLFLKSIRLILNVFASAKHAFKSTKKVI